MKKLISVKDVADTYGVSEWTIRRWVREKNIGAIKIGNTYKFTEEDLQAFEEKMRIRPEE